MMEASAWEIRLRTAETRLDSSHKSISKLRDSSARHDTEITVMRTELREVRDDLEEIKKALASNTKALYIVASCFATFTLSVVGLTATLLNG